MNQSSLFAGTALADITPPLEVGFLTSSVDGTYAPFRAVRLPLNARVLVLKHQDGLAALVSVDLLALSDTSVGGWGKFKRGLSSVIPGEQVILTCTHTHSAPESVALSDLYQTEAYQIWLRKVQTSISQAIDTALAGMQPCKVAYAMDTLEGFSLQRRIHTPGGIVMSDSVQPIADALMNQQPVDRRVHIIRLVDSGGKPLVHIVHAICHPVHEMCLPEVSSDFPGELCNFLQERGSPGHFLNGAAGDTNPPTVSEGPASARKHGQALGAIVLKDHVWNTVDSSEFQVVHEERQFSPRPDAKIDNPGDATARFSAIRIGSLAIVFLPGEPFVETALQIEKESPFAHTIVAGFGENNIGYIPTEKAFAEGGYETGPGKWSFLPIGSDRVIKAKALELLNRLHPKQ